MLISLCMIVKDEEEVLSRCLTGVEGLADEIVIADTGSTDKTLEIAKTYTKKVYRIDWTDDFSAARNFAFSKGEGDYLLWLDADDALSSESKANFEKLRAFLEEERPDAVMCPYELTQNGEARTVFYRERFLRREANFRWQGRVHECIAPRGKVMRFDLRVRHLGSGKDKGDRNLRIYQRWAREEALSARDLFYYGRELYYRGLYVESEAILNEALRKDGWYVNQIDACRTLSLVREGRGDKEGALTALFESFRYGEPRAYVLCSIGRLFKEKGRLKEAVCWYEWALRCGDHTEEGDFEEPACRDLIPMLELVCLYYALGERERAAKMHKKTEAIRPDHPSVEYNRRFFGEQGLL